MKNELKIRNVICDYYFSALNQFNYCKYGKTKQKSLQFAFPTMRIFGILDSGQKCCAHVHGYLPYVIVRTRSPLTIALQNILINIIVECNENNIFQIKGTSKLVLDEIILGIFGERGRSIYGYDGSNDFFIKIYFYNPLFAKAFATILQEESKQFQWLQPFNIHIPFTLQFFIDFSLHGMDYVHLENVYYRRGSQNIDENSRISPLVKMSKCAVEFDIYTDSILNTVICKKNRIFESIGLDFIWKEEKRRCEILKMETPKQPDEKKKSIKQEGNIDDLFTNKCKKEFKEILNGFKLIKESFSSIDEDEQTKNEFHLTFLENENNIGINYETMLQMEIEANYCPSTSSNRSSQRFWENVEYRSMGFDVDDFDDEEEENNLTYTLDESQIILSGDDEQNEMIENRNGGMEESTTKESSKTDGKIDIEKLDELLNISPKCGHPIIPKRTTKLSIVNENNNNKTPQNRQQQQRQPFCWQKPFCPTPRTPLSLGTLFKSKNNENEEDLLLRDAQSNVDNLCVLSLEILTFPTNGSKRPIADPIHDQIYALLFSYHSDICNWRQEDEEDKFKFMGIAIKKYWIKESTLLAKINGKILMVENEMELLNEAAKFILKMDPELLIGYDIKRFSWGYLFERAKALQISFKSTISRIKDSNGNIPKTPFSPPHGRLILEVWWNVRRERPLRSFRLGNVVKELLNMKFPELDCAYLSEMFSTNQIGIRTTIFKYFMRKSLLNLQILCKLDIFVRTCQMARVYGIQFEGVLTRGSQFRVESMLLRLATQRRIFAPSVSIDQRIKMVTPEFIPLNIEPRAGLYLDPVIVLDFQSLYPSISIAYNYCFNTCLGKVSNYKNLLNILSDSNGHSTQKYNIPLGSLNYQICQFERLMELLKSNQLTFAPNGAIFVKRNIRMGLLPIMLTELLDTRVMVKNAMKMHAKNQKLTRLLDARQLALKLIANTTYGYTAANWSGRMPCEEVADAIVSKGRETLEKAIEEIDGAPLDKYKGAKVIYGDTDSVFVICKGLSKKEAFIIGQQIADDITSQNPYPIKLKFEKIMHPCCLIAKKRYMGMSYENAEDEKGNFDSKGIETIRRDSPPFVARVMEHFLCILFNKSIISALDYLKNRLNRLEITDLDEFFFSLDYIGDYSKMSKSRANKIAKELTKLSERLTPLYGERLVYVITKPKIELESNEDNPSTYLANTISVETFLRDSNLHLDLDYYIQHQLFPALQRVLDNIPLKLDLHYFKSDDHNQQQNPIQLLYGDEDARTTIRRIFITKGNMVNTIEKLKRICNECIGPVKSIEIEGFQQCLNHNCPVKRKAAATQKMLSTEESVFIDYFLHNF